jgi:16S rRNA (uracil1498-N3)-methyltransferase
VRRLLVGALPAPGELVRAGPAESHHLLHVLRAPIGERIRVMDGAGLAGIATLDAIDPDGRAALRVLTHDAPRVRPARVVLLGFPKPALLEEALTLGTEGGATTFVLVRAERSPPGGPRHDRLERVLRAAVTQCGRPDIPGVLCPADLGAALADPDLPAERWLAAPGARPLGRVPGPAATVAGPSAGPDGAMPSSGDPGDGDSGSGAHGAVVAIGPEGGWSPAEVAALLAAGFVPGGLGPYVLRTPSAVGAALARLW